jgi:hypothetical protein
VNKLQTIIQRIGAVFIVSSLPIIGGSSMIGGIPVWKAAILAGFTACSEVFIKLARASLDGELTMEEINEAFVGVKDGKNEK